MINELPFLAFVYLLAATVLAFAQGDVDSPSAWAVVALAVLTVTGLLLIGRRGPQTGRVLERALGDGLGPGWRAAINAGMAARLRRRIPLARPLWRGWAAEPPRRLPPPLASVRRTHAGVLARRRLLQRPQESRSTPAPAPAREPGWVCISANHCLRPPRSPTI